MTAPSPRASGHALLLAGTGVVTALPLLLFSAAATRVPLSTLGLLQYVAPVIQFLIGVLVFDEVMGTGRWIGFLLVWVALVIITLESLVHSRRVSRAARAARLDPLGDAAGSVC